MTSNLYKRYPCRAQGHLDLTIKNPNIPSAMNSPLLYEGEWKLIKSEPKNYSPTKRIHTFKSVNAPDVGVWTEIEVEVTPRGPNSKWSKQWD